MSMWSKRPFEGWAGRHGHNLWSVFPENGKLVFYGSQYNPHGFIENPYSNMDRELETIELKKDQSKIFTGEVKKTTINSKEKEGEEAGHPSIYQEVIRSFSLSHHDNLNVNDNVNVNTDSDEAKVKSVLTRDGSLNFEASFPPRTSRIRLCL